MSKENIQGKKIFVLDSHDLSYWHDTKDAYHISEFRTEDEDLRIKAREWVNSISTTISQKTGKPFYQSFMYKGVSAWWFIEINLHEPAYLSIRRQKALERAGEIGSAEIRTFHPGKSPVILPVMTAASQKTAGSKPSINLVKVLFKKVKARLPAPLATIITHLIIPFYGFGLLLKKFLILLINLFKKMFYKHKDVLIVIEEANLKRNIDPISGAEFTYIPYAEGVIELLAEKSGESIEVLSRGRLRKKHKGWGFLKKSLPLVIPKQLPDDFEDLINELDETISPTIGGYISANDLKEIMKYRLAEFNIYLDILNKINPKVVFAYNWEGVFRPLVAAARLQRRKVIGIQQALGPYCHGIDHHETGYWTSNNNRNECFCIPDKYFVWSEFHQQKIVGYEYYETVVECTGYPRMDRHAFIRSKKEELRNTIAKSISLNPHKRYLLFTAQYLVLDTCLIIKENYIKTYQYLLKLADEFDFSIIIKPWASDNIDFLMSLAAERTDRVYFASQDLKIHNADLLALTDWCVGTFSSIMGEATLMDNQCFLLNYPESRYYFGDEYMQNYNGMAVFINSPEEIEEKLRLYITTPSMKNDFMGDAQKQLRYIFGDCDGSAAVRCADLILECLK